MKRMRGRGEKNLRIGRKRGRVKREKEEVEVKGVWWLASHCVVNNMGGGGGGKGMV